MKRISIAATLVALSVSAQASFSTQPKVIYGDDNRADVYQVDRSDLRELADSTVAMINSTKLTQRGNVFEIKAQAFGPAYDLCKDELYYSQPNPASCSGFLVGEDMIATAGHCINEASCDKNSFVFNYKMQSSSIAPTEVSSDDVYKCAKIIVTELSNNQDYSLVKLDRPVRGHRILTMSKDPVKVNDDIFVIGHPAGLPTKIAGGASVRKQEKGYFVANLDTYGGNSGSAVFDARTLNVVGILVRGEQDFEYDSQRQCRFSKKCANNKCRGEDVTNIKYITDAIK